jgi:hypothetical protein
MRLAPPPRASGRRDAPPPKAKRRSRLPDPAASELALYFDYSAPKVITKRANPT